MTGEYKIEVYAYDLDPAALEALFTRVADAAHALDEQVTCIGPHAPTLEGIRAYLRSGGWTPQPPGPAGVIWTCGEQSIGVPDDPDPALIEGVIVRIARVETDSPEAVRNDIIARGRPG